jgi:2-polyprenyl-3-methyl-5-hydroxy-6-metoxy-1,4-benzoquinol methylase
MLQMQQISDRERDSLRRLEEALQTIDSTWKAEKEALSELQRQLVRMGFTKADRQSVADIGEQLGMLEARKADQPRVAELAEELKASRQELATISQQFQSLSARMDDQEPMAEIQRQLARLSFRKAERSEMEDLQEKLNHKVEKQEFTDLAKQLDTALATNADQQRRILDEMRDLLEQRPDRRELEAALAVKADERRLAQTAEEITALLLTAEQKSREFAAQVQAVLAAKADEQRVAQSVEELKGLIGERAERGTLETVQSDLLSAKGQIQQNRQMMLEQQWRIAVFLDLARRRLPEPFTAGQLQQLQDTHSHTLDSLYVAFEDRFRGTREHVKEDVTVYLPLVREARNRTGDLPILDVACGRGEWLELLREQGYKAGGVDLNRAMTEICLERGLDVVQEDAVTYLRRLPHESYSVVTSFHFIEHIDMHTQVSLLDEMLRILKPGGVAILETPNARNILVTAGDFYRDPTHRHPVFPDTLEALAELRGFARSTAYCFNEGRTSLIPLSEYLFPDLNAYITISRDMAWVGVKE